MSHYTTERSSDPPTQDGRGPSDRRRELAIGRLAVILLGSGVLQLAGRALDGVWHANHDEFEAARQQLEAHWLLWIAVLATIAVCVIALRRPDLDGRVAVAFRITLGSAAVYAGVAVWHFIEHANHNDPALPHVLLAITQIAMLVGILLTFIRARRVAPPRATREA
jgi:hypothetical protein